MTVTEQVVSGFKKGISGDRFREIFDFLESQGFKPLGKSNTKTLLFRYKVDGVYNDVFAFRVGPPQVISFPKSFWTSRKAQLAKHLSSFSFSNRIETGGAFTSSQYSLGQIEITKKTQVKIMELCKEVKSSI